MQSNIFLFLILPAILVSSAVSVNSNLLSFQESEHLLEPASAEHLDCTPPLVEYGDECLAMGGGPTKAFKPPSLFRSGDGVRGSSGVQGQFVTPEQSEASQLSEENCITDPETGQIRCVASELPFAQTLTAIDEGATGMSPSPSLQQPLQQQPFATPPPTTEPVQPEPNQLITPDPQFEIGEQQHSRTPLGGEERSRELFEEPCEDPLSRECIEKCDNLACVAQSQSADDADTSLVVRCNMPGFTFPGECSDLEKDDKGFYRLPSPPPPADDGPPDDEGPSDKDDPGPDQDPETPTTPDGKGTIPEPDDGNANPKPPNVDPEDEGSDQ